MYPLLIIGTFSVLVSWLFYNGRLVLDDWEQIVSYHVFGQSRWFAWGRIRPLDLTAYKMIGEIFGLNLFAYYFINTLIILGVFFMIYILLSRLLPQLRPFALVVSLVGLLYPADFTLSWITMINNRLAWLIALVGMWFLLEYVIDGGLYRLALAGLCLFVPLWIHEGALGISFAWCFFLAIISRKAEGRRRLAVLSPMILLVLFFVLRVFVRPRMGVYDANAVNLVNVSPEFIWFQLKQIVILVRAWVEPLPELFIRMGFFPQPKRFFLAGLALLIGLAMLIGYALLRRYQPGDQQPLSPGDKKQMSKALGWTIFFAAGFVVAGYIPYLMNFSPNLDDISTRANMFAIPAAAAIIAALIGLFALLISKSISQWRLLLWTGAIPLLLIGLGAQVIIQARWGAAWDQQTQIWKKLFEIAPDFAENTTVVLVQDGYQDPGYVEHPPLYAQWEIEHALRVLYEDYSLKGRILFPSTEIHSEARLSPEGVIGAYDLVAPDYREPAAFNEVVFIRGSARQGTIEVIYDLAEEFDLPFQPAGYNPNSRIDAVENKNWRYRFLVLEN